MSRGVKLSLVAVVVLWAAAAVVRPAEARPNYCKAFLAQYENVAEAKEAKCAICHPGKEKKERNDYGAALGKTLGGPKVEEEAKIKDALKKTEGEKSSVEGKTFGDLLKAGKLPGKKPADKQVSAEK